MHYLKIGFRPSFDQLGNSLAYRSEKFYREDPLYFAFVQVLVTGCENILVISPQTYMCNSVT